MIRKTGAHVRGRESVPNHIRDIAGDVIKSTRLEIGLVSKRQKRDARADTRAENSNPFISLLFQPAHRRARVEHGLSHRLNRAPDIGADEMIRAFEFRGLSLLVIGKRQAQRRHSDHVEDAAGFNVAFRLRVPLRQDDDGIARFPLRFFSGKNRARAMLFSGEGVCTELVQVS